MAKLDAFLKFMHDHGASDLHMVAGRQPTVRIRGDIERLQHRILEDHELRGMLYDITPDYKIKLFEETGDVDFGYEIPGMDRYRANLFKHKNGIGAVFREIPRKIMTAKQLGLPEVVTKLATLPRGLVLVTGPTGCGKSSTLAAIINEANGTRKDHIITIEDPIEFVYESKECIVDQREVGVDSKSFSSALRGALREDPDIILVGEMRDLETISLAVEAANTGHLVLSTLHTRSAASSIDRIIEVFPAHQQAQIRSSLSDGIRAVVAQVLFKRIDKEKRCPAVEVMIATPAIRNLIRQAKTHLIPGTIEVSQKYGMQLLDDHIRYLLKKDWISHAEAFAKANDKEKFRPYVTREDMSIDFSEI
jgi:twitching motility protein PilT